MAFFEEVGKKITDTGAGVTKTAKNFGELTHLNSEISEKEKQIIKLYENLGKAYYDRHWDDSGAEEPEIIKRINELNAEILQRKERIKQIKGVEKCSECGADVPLEATFCSVCGTKMERIDKSQPAPATQQVCTSCNETIPAEATFCPLCGAKVETVVSTEAVQEERRCPSCNNVVPDEDMFCCCCGTKMEKA